MTTYQDFLSSKLSKVTPSGFDVDSLPNYLFDYQSFIVKLALKKGKFAIFANTGLGKALRDGTKVLTPDGWVNIESIKVGDSVFGSSGTPCPVVGVFPQGERQLYRVSFSDGTAIDCDGDHLWTTKTRNHRAKNKPGRTLTTNQIIQDGLFDKDGGKRHFIDMVKPIEFTESVLPLDPYFIGVLIGDGGLSEGSVGLTTDNEIINSLILPEKITAKLESVLTESVSTVRLSLNCGTNGKTYHPLLDPLNELGLRYCRSYEKFIPSSYLFGSIQQRLDLLAGLLDTDGSTYDGTIEYCTSSYQLALDVQFLVQSLGGTAPIGIKKTKYTYKGEAKNGLDAYRLNISLGHYCPFKLSRKVKAWIPKPQRANVPRSIIKIEKVDIDQATCISIDSPDSLYVTEGCVLTHNTAMQLAWADAVYQQTKRPVLILAPLAVAKQTANDEADKFNVTVKYCESQSDVINGINITNYEKLSKFDTDCFVGIVLDESSILKSYSGAICQSIFNAFVDTPYKLACSATPSPNDHIELGSHSEFLGIMTGTEMLSQFFVNDTKAPEKWRLKKHAKNPFWQWLAEWSIMIQKPSDLGFSDDAYQLPPLVETDLFIETELKREGELFALTATGLLEQRQIKKQTLDLRCEVIANLVNNSDDQWLVWCETNAESALLKSLIPDAVEVKGSDKDKHKEQSAHDFAHGKIRVLVSKASIFGFGLNFQSCHNVAFASLSNSFEMTYQAIRRCYRFGQKEQVNVYYAVTDTCTAIKQNMERKTAQFHEMFSQLVKYMGNQAMTATTAQKNDYSTNYHEGENFKLYLGDCVEAMQNLDDESIDFSVFSPPFSGLYVWSNSERDMANSRDDAEFYEHFKYLVKDLYRVIKPGRLVSFHCMDLPTQLKRDGYLGVKDLSGDLIRLFQAEGFIYHSKVTIWKDPGIAMQRTKSISLLHKQTTKDKNISRQGLPDYLVTMRKPGVNENPMSGYFTEYHGDDDSFLTGDEYSDSIKIWNRYASPVWMDINPSDTLQFREARSNDDERHLTPLQLTVIRRAMQLWSNPGDLVLSPFCGIGSEGYVSLDMGRRFIGAELKKSYYEVAVKNLEYIENKPKQLSLTDLIAS